MDVRLRWLLETQEDLIAFWQLRALGWSQRQIEARAWRNDWRPVHDGVYACAAAALTRRRRWIAATLTAPGTLLAAASAGACHGFRPWEASFEVVVRPGSGGPRMFRGLLVMRSTTLAADIDWSEGIPITSPERTLIDLAPHVSARALAKATREAIRLKSITAHSLLDALSRHRGRRGTKALRELAITYSQLPIARARSDAESYALERLFRAGATIPALNEEVGGVEADLVDHGRKLVVELDGPQFHLFPEEDARKEEAWRAAGYEVVRIPTDDVFR